MQEEISPLCCAVPSLSLFSMFPPQGRLNTQLLCTLIRSRCCASGTHTNIAYAQCVLYLILRTSNQQWHGHRNMTLSWFPFRSFKGNSALGAGYATSEPTPCDLWCFCCNCRVGPQCAKLEQLPLGLRQQWSPAANCNNLAKPVLLVSIHPKHATALCPCLLALEWEGESRTI